MNKFQQWASNRKSKQTEPEPEVTPDVTPTPGEELREAWEDWTYHFRLPILIFKCVLWGFGLVIVMWAIAVADIQNDCYSDSVCRERMEELN